MMKEIIILLSNNMLFKALLICVSLDSILGALRAIKEHKFNSCVGIDGAIRKAAMLFSVCLLMSIDVIMDINKMGICEFFSLLFILYEAVSILKNMTLCGVPVPTRIKNFIQKFLEDMTEELPDQEGETNHEI